MGHTELTRRNSLKPSSAQDVTSQSDPDTCRICRGEGSAEEPLFYPCKCSGSIKYVHQDCLMEWLSHSQKKHCELCKTPFRFTKLYAPNMPKTVPFHVFVSHITKYIFRNMLVWARAGLVLMVWLIWLPYLMRRLWSTLFWLSDDGLGPIFERAEATSSMATSAVPISGTATCPSTPLLVQTTTAATLQSIMSQMPKSASSSATTSVYGINITTDNPLYTTLLNMFLGSFYAGGAASRSNAWPVVQPMTPAPPMRPPTLLSDVRFLQKLSSSSPALGNFAIDVLEGQIITVVVIICFILIILVRDYVVQQQPDINMRAAFAAAENQMQAQNAEPAQPPEAEDADLAHAMAPTNAGPELQPVIDDDDDEVDDDDEEEDRLSVLAIDGDVMGPRPLHDELGNAVPRRQVPAENDGRPDSPTAGFRPGDAFGMIPISDRDVMRSWQESNQEYRMTAGEGRVSGSTVANRENIEDQPQQHLGLRGRTQAFEEEGEPSSRQDIWLPDTEWALSEAANTGGQNSDKGKHPINGDTDQTHGVRPRSATDGPQRMGGTNPLGHNNWAFSDVQSHLGRDSSSTPSNARHAPAVDTSGAASHAWNYITPPSSAMAASTASSIHEPTPSTSDNDELGAGEVGVGLNAEIDSSSQQNWEAISDVDQQLALEPGADGPVDVEAPEQLRPIGLAQRVADFMWRDVEAIPAHELPPIPEAADDFFDHDQDAAVAIVEDPLQQQMQDRDQEEILAAAAEVAGIDAEAEAIEDAEDLEGILELLGMRGPIAGLFQNALFCAFLVSITLFLGVFFPYNLGRTSIWLIANPTRPIRILFSVSKAVQDSAMLLMGFTSTVLLGCLDTLFSLLRPGAAQLEPIRNMVHGSWNMTGNAAERLMEIVRSDLPFISTDEVRNFSIVSHAALLTLKAQATFVLATIGKCVLFLFGGNYITKVTVIVSSITGASSTLWQGIKDIPALVSIQGSWVIDLGTSDLSVPLNPELATWSASDRMCAILGGYVTMCVVAAFYLGRGGPITPGRVGQEWEATIIDALIQASGVMKVILIIGIEMLIFPLYCGLLLDVALLPLFEDTTIMSRVMFTVNYPLTSIFVHWFVGTGYMFHFALFVSMCRKIMRKGVLCQFNSPITAAIVTC